MRRLMVLATLVAIMILVVTIGTARALDGYGCLVVIGASPWEVKERCGGPSAIEDVMEQFPQRADDPISQIPVNILVPVPQSLWTDNVGPTRFLYDLYDLTFQEGKLIDITTGDYGHSTGEDAERGPGAGTYHPGHQHHAEKGGFDMIDRATRCPVHCTAPFSLLLNTG